MKTFFEIPTLMSLPSILKMKFSAEKIYYNFSHENPKITICIKSSQTRYALWCDHLFKKAGQFGVMIFLCFFRCLTNSVEQNVVSYCMLGVSLKPSLDSPFLWKISAYIQSQRPMEIWAIDSGFTEWRTLSACWILYLMGRARIWSGMWRNLCFGELWWHLMLLPL